MNDYYSIKENLPKELLKNVPCCQAHVLSCQQHKSIEILYETIFNDDIMILDQDLSIKWHSKFCKDVARSQSGLLEEEEVVVVIDKHEFFFLSVLFVPRQRCRLACLSPRCTSRTRHVFFSKLPMDYIPSPLTLYSIPCLPVHSLLALSLSSL